MIMMLMVWSNDGAACGCGYVGGAFDRVPRGGPPQPPAEQRGHIRIKKIITIIMQSISEQLSPGGGRDLGARRPHKHMPLARGVAWVRVYDKRCPRGANADPGGQRPHMWTTPPDTYASNTICSMCPSGRTHVILFVVCGPRHVRHSTICSMWPSARTQFVASVVCRPRHVGH